MESEDSFRSQITESLTDLPSVMREKIDYCDEVDFLETSTPNDTQNSLYLDFHPNEPHHAHFYQNRPNNFDPGNFYSKINKFDNLENILEEESCELDNSRLTEKRKTFNEFDKNMVEILQNNKICLLESQRSFLKGIDFNLKKDTFITKINNSSTTFDDRKINSPILKDTTDKQTNLINQSENYFSNAKNSVYQNFLKFDKNLKNKTAKILNAKNAVSEKKKPVETKRNSSKLDSNPLFQKSITLSSQNDTKRNNSTKTIPNVQIYNNNNFFINIHKNCKLTKGFVEQVLNGSKKIEFESQSLLLPKNAFTKKNKVLKNDSLISKITPKTHNLGSIIPFDYLKAKPKKTHKLFNTIELKESQQIKKIEVKKCKTSQKLLTPPTKEPKKTVNTRTISSFSLSNYKIPKKDKLKSLETKTVSKNFGNDSSDSCFQEQPPHIRNITGQEYYFDSDLKPDPTLSKAQHSKIHNTKRRSQGHQDVRLGNTQDTFLANLLENKSQDINPSQSIKNNPLMYLDIDEFTDDPPDSRAFSQFEISNDSLKPLHGKFCQIDGTSNKFFESGHQKSVLETKHLFTKDFGNMSSSLNNFYNKFHDSSSAHESTTHFPPNNPRINEKRPTFDKAYIYNLKPDKKKYTEVDLYNMRDFRQTQSKQFFNTGMYEFKHDRTLRGGEQNSINDLKFVKLDRIKPDFVERSVISDHFSASGKNFKKDNQSKATFYANKFKDSDSLAKFEKISAISVMTNSDLQQMLALNSKIYNKAKQLIRF